MTPLQPRVLSSRLPLRLHRLRRAQLPRRQSLRKQHHRQQPGRQQPRRQQPRRQQPRRQNCGRPLPPASLWSPQRPHRHRLRLRRRKLRQSQQSRSRLLSPAAVSLAFAGRDPGASTRDLGTSARDIQRRCRRPHDPRHQLRHRPHHPIRGRFPVTAGGSEDVRQDQQTGDLLPSLDGFDVTMGPEMLAAMQTEAKEKPKDDTETFNPYGAPTHRSRPRQDSASGSSPRWWTRYG